ncbi:S-adenosylmethionine:tRNA ribosyltransferase-isomerase [Ravibacter arvi]|uniref:S-adenosylmethionine:tRNA ribosyltransferase-isomerase n=1 Tax=Ravibacter arvi TaxID=2051041 RepID=A0ABP8LWI3_9BACT
MLLSEFQYHLPDDRIARYPLPDRDRSKLLVYEAGRMVHSRFDRLSDYIPADTLLVFNDTKVIPARAIFQKSSGAKIELLMLHPEEPTRIVSEAMQVRHSCTWNCMVGNKKRWKEGDELVLHCDVGEETVAVRASWHDRERNLVTFSWNGDHPFVDVVVAIGSIPLPPYLGREAESADSDTYQTVYARQNGAVAAPTAGLHFTEDVLEGLAAKGVERAFVTLHVGAGTFQPIKAQNVREHDMHGEQLVFTKDLVSKVAAHQGRVVGVGTTSLRSLESLYWLGVGILEGDTALVVQQNAPYTDRILPTRRESLNAVLDFMEQRETATLIAETRIFITPGYRFRILDGLVTNFHQPGSTLILLIAAFVGSGWRAIYDSALAEGYRFLSYGDSSLIWTKNKDGA